jgi:hypothetical protein
MAGLTSREGEAIKKALDLDTLDKLQGKVTQLEYSIRMEESLTNYRAKEATRILEPKKYKDGREIRAKGDLFKNLVEGLDESGLISAVTAVKSVMLDVEAKRAIWLTAAEKRADEAGFLPHKKYDRIAYAAITMST